MAQSDCLAADRQGQGDTRLTLTPSVIPNSNYVIMVGDWNCLKYVCVFLYSNHQVHRDFLITLYSNTKMVPRDILQSCELFEPSLQKLLFCLSELVNTVDPRVTTGLTYDQLGLRPKILVLTYDQSLELRPECLSRPKRVSACAVVNKDPRCVRKRQSEPRYACLWT
jgi:hypothetical protein